MGSPPMDSTRPPDPLHVMSTQYECTGACLRYTKMCMRCCRLNIAQEHAHQTLGTPMHRIRVPRDEVPGRGCRGRGPPLPPPAQGTLITSENSYRRRFEQT